MKYICIYAIAIIYIIHKCSCHARYYSIGSRPYDCRNATVQQDNCYSQKLAAYAGKSHTLTLTHKNGPRVTQRITIFCLVLTYTELLTLQTSGRLLCSFYLYFAEFMYRSIGVFATITNTAQKCRWRLPEIASGCRLLRGQPWDNRGVGCFKD